MRQYRFLKFVLTMIVFGGIPFLGFPQSDLSATEDRETHILSYHDGVPSGYWEQLPYNELGGDQYSFLVHIWCGSDGYYPGEMPDIYGSWFIEKLRFYHYGEGNMLIRVYSAIIDDENSSNPCTWCPDYLEIEFSTQCSDCWEEVILNYEVSCMGGCCGYGPGVMNVISFESRSQDAEGYATPVIGSGGLEDGPNGAVHPHPFSSMLGCGTHGIFWHHLCDEPYPCGDYLVDIYWHSGGQTAEQGRSFSNVKSLY